MKENVLLASMIRLLTYHKNAKNLNFLRVNSGCVFVHGRKIRLAEKGTSDIIVFARNGKTVFFEAKSSTGKQSQEQSEFQSMMESLGYTYYLIDSIKKFDEVLQLYGVPKMFEYMD